MTANEPQIKSPPSGNEIRVEDAKARPSILPNGNSAVYLKIVNPKDESDRLVAVESSVTDNAETHETINDNNIMRMQPRPEGFEIPKNAVIDLEPGGKHIMLINIAEPLKIGDQISVTLRFERADPIELLVPVQEIERSR